MSNAPFETSQPSDTATKRAVLIVAAVSSFVTPFMSASVNVALPAIESHFRMNAVMLAWVQTSFLLATAVCLLPFGKIADIYGRKKVYVGGTVLFTISSLIAAAAPSAFVLLLARVLQGMSAAMLSASVIAIITSVFPFGERGRAIGITVSVVYIGLSAGPFLGGILTQHLSWRSVFGGPAPLGFLMIYLSITRLKGEWADAKGERLDIAGAVLYGAAICLIMYGLSTLPSWESVAEITAGVTLLALFVWWEFRAPQPVFNLELFTSNRAFSLSSLAAMINYSATFAVTFLLSLYLQYVHGLSPQAAGLVLIAQPVMMAALSPLAGRMSDRIEPRKVASLGMAFTALGLFGLTRLEAETSIAFIVGDLLVLGFGFALFSSPNMNAIMSSVEKRFYGIAGGAVSSMRLLGQMFSMGIATLVLSVCLGPVEITPERFPDFMTSVVVSFIVFGCLCSLGIFASLARGPIRGD